MLAVYMITLSVAANATPVTTTAPTANARPEHTADFELGSGLAFKFDSGQHFVKVGGFIQPAWGIEQPEGEDIQQFLNARRTYFSLQGSFFKETVDFFFQTDFSLSEPLLDAWLGVNVCDCLSISFGQRQALTNNREMLHMESQLTFTRRSLLSRTFSLSGRELGAFAFGQVDLFGFLIRPQLSVTSGDGRNSFGADSRDVDIGGFKWGARVDLLPFGNFTEGNRGMVADLERERSLKLVLGGALSYNDGASHRNGAGHGEFFLYDGEQDEQLPDYVLIYADLLLKFRGLSLLAEFVDASATSLDGLYTDDASTNLLFRTQISEFLVLGTGVNGQLGYYFEVGGGAGLGIDLRYTRLFAEFSENEASLLQDATAYGAGLTVYVLKQTLKVQLNFERIDIDGRPTTTGGDLLVQLIL